MGGAGILVDLKYKSQQSEGKNLEYLALVAMVELVLPIALFVRFANCFLGALIKNWGRMVVDVNANAHEPIFFT